MPERKKNASPLSPAPDSRPASTPGVCSDPARDYSGTLADDHSPDPLSSAALKGPGLLESMLGAFMGQGRAFDVLQIEVSSFCPAACTYCPHTTMKDRWLNRHLPAETFAALWPLLRRAGRVHLQGWGEPLLHPRFLDFAAVAQRAGCRVSTTTCGLVMNEELAAGLVRSGIDVLAFSLAGTDAASNASRRGAPFEKVCDNIRILQKVRKKLVGVHLEVHIAYLLLASQLPALERLPELLEELGAHAAVVSSLDFVARPDLAAEAFRPHERDKIERARGILGAVARRAEQSGRNVYYSLPAAAPREDCLENAERSLYVDADGRISPCIYLNLPLREPEGDEPVPGRVFGRIGAGPLADDPLEVWSRAEYQAFRDGLRQGKPDECCRQCPKRYAVGNREGGSGSR